jgi:hypothetical protein
MQREAERGGALPAAFTPKSTAFDAESIDPGDP